MVNGTLRRSKSTGRQPLSL